MTEDVGNINQEAEGEAPLLGLVRQEVGRVIVGQRIMVERLLCALLCNNHVLIEGLPGLAKTRTVTTLARCLRVGFSRVQFTPDLLPGDLVGTMIYNPKEGVFSTRKGPIFANIVLADEINRAPAKVQSALLEAMQERQVTIGDATYPLDEPFMVLATQNPVDQEGTYPLPEAQVDRFMFKLRVEYPSREEELLVLRRMAGAGPEAEANPVMTPEDIVRLRRLARRIYMDEKIERYIVDLVAASRDPAEVLGGDGHLVRHGASPRATIFLAQAAKAQALLAGRGYVVPQDVKDIAMDVMRHRIAVTYEAEADGVAPEDVVRRLLDAVPVP